MCFECFEKVLTDSMFPVGTNKSPNARVSQELSHPPLLTQSRLSGKCWRKELEDWLEARGSQVLPTAGAVRLGMILVVLFFSIYFASVHLPFVSGIHPTQIPVFCLSVFCLSELRVVLPPVLGERCVGTQSNLHISRQYRGDTKPPLRSRQSHGLGTHTLVPVSTACSGNALCCTNQNIYSSPLSQCSPYLWKYQTCSKMEEILKTPSIVLQPWGTWALL